MSKPIIGLVGGIGSGKSHVAAAFVKHGGRVIAGDPFGHEALKQPDILTAIQDRWGDRVLDTSGQVDRKKMAGIVFASPAEREHLEEMVFPWITKRIREEIARAQADPAVAFIVLDAAVMLEAGWNHECERIVFIDVPGPLRIQRLQTQRGWSPEEIERREAAQLPLSVKSARADVTLDNAGTLEDTQKQVDALVEKWSLRESLAKKNLA